MVPEGRKTAASLPSRSATRSCSAFVVGSPAICSSPTSAFAMVLRMAAEGLLAVSLASSIRRLAPMRVLSFAPPLWKPVARVRARRRLLSSRPARGRCWPAGFGASNLGQCCASTPGALEGGGAHVQLVDRHPCRPGRLRGGAGLVHPLGRVRAQHRGVVGQARAIAAFSPRAQHQKDGVFRGWRDRQSGARRARLLARPLGAQSHALTEPYGTGAKEKRPASRSYRAGQENGHSFHAWVPIEGRNPGSCLPDSRPCVIRIATPGRPDSGLFLPAPVGRLLPICDVAARRCDALPLLTRAFHGARVTPIEQIDDAIVGGDVGDLGPVNQKAYRGSIGIVV